MPTLAGGDVKSMQTFQDTEKEKHNICCSNIFSSLDFCTGFLQHK